MSKTINRQSGFAIGTILLAVILIAAIVSAIAIASRGSSTQSGREQARVQASTLLQQGANLRSGFERMVANGNDRGSITASADGADQAANCTNAAVTNPNPANAVNCLYHTTEGGTTVQQISSAAMDPAGGNMTRYYLIRGVILSGVGNGNNIVVALGDLRLDVCRQINNQVNGMLVTADPPASAGINAPATLLALAEENAANGVDLQITAPANTAFVSNTVLQNWPEGCISLQGTVGGSEADSHIWYKVLSEG